MFVINDKSTVNITNGSATLTCNLCGLEKANFPLKIAAPFNGGAFVLSTDTFGCPCGYITVFPLRGTDTVSAALTQLSGF